jgi:hypothetical protein
MDESDAKGRAKGGKKRAEVLSAEERREIAQKGAAARWGEKLPQAMHKGNFKKEFGIDVDCYVLNDRDKTAVISQTGMGGALGLSSRGNALPRFLAGRAMAESVSAELREKLARPLKFQWQSGSAEVPTLVHGFDVTLLADICKAIVDAESKGKLGARYAGIVRQAHVIQGASAKAGIRGLVWALAGYNPTTQVVIDAFKAYVQAEAKKYEREFPNELYLEWHRLYEVPVPVRGKPWLLKDLTVKHVYYPLAQSSGKILTLLRALKANGGDRQKKLFQFLNEIGARALRIQLGRVLEMCESSPDRATYEQKVFERFGGQQAFDFSVPLPSTSTEPQPPSER